MELNDIVNMIVNNSVSVAIIVYFCIRDWKFQDTLVVTLTSIQEILKKIEKENK